ncbi:MAG: hypothetical protein IPJ34_25305 [Myxococcales bacterium]|nr:hypothetical protein [Myxococcales bacterium]
MRAVSQLDPSQLLDEARSLLGVLRRQARRAFVLELTGTPKAGKTTSVNVLERFFSKAGFRVHVLKERAGECPLLMKGHFFFNAWTTCSMLAEVLERVETDVDLLILDRGFFDALVWLELQLERGQVTDEEHKAFREFVLLERWRRLVDLTVVTSVDPEIAVQRENLHLIVPREGSMMNKDALLDFNGALERAEKAYENEFNLLRFHSEADVKQSNTELVHELLPRIRRWADPEILVLPRDLVDAAMGGAIGDHTAFLDVEAARDALARWAAAVRPMPRSEAEADGSVVQLVGCGVPTCEGSFFALRRSLKDEKVRQYGEYTLWKGCHIAGFGGSSSLEAPIAAQVAQRVREDLYVAEKLEPTLLGLAWTPGEAHVGILFEVPVSPAVGRSMEQKEYRKQGRYETLSGKKRARAELATLGLERWSHAYLDHTKPPS